VTAVARRRSESELKLLGGLLGVDESVSRKLAMSGWEERMEGAVAYFSTTEQLPDD